MPNLSNDQLCDALALGDALADSAGSPYIRRLAGYTRDLIAEVAEVRARRCGSCVSFDGLGRERGLCTHLVSVRAADWCCADWKRREVTK